MTAKKRPTKAGAESASEPEVLRRPLRDLAADAGDERWLITVIRWRERWDFGSRITAAQYADARERALASPINQ
jgi:hypothetical protein